MPVAISKKSHFADVILRALLLIESGGAEVATFGMSTGAGMKLVTVGGAWIGDIFSWRIVEGAEKSLTASQGAEIYAGMGDDQDVLYAAARLTYSLAAAANGEDWALMG